MHRAFCFTVVLLFGAGECYAPPASQAFAPYLNYYYELYDFERDYAACVLGAQGIKGSFGCSYSSDATAQREAPLVRIDEPATAAGDVELGHFLRTQGEQRSVLLPFKHFNASILAALTASGRVALLAVEGDSEILAASTTSPAATVPQEAFLSTFARPAAPAVQRPTWNPTGTEAGLVSQRVHFPVVFMYDEVLTLLRQRARFNTISRGAAGKIDYPAFYLQAAMPMNMDEGVSTDKAKKATLAATCIESNTCAVNGGASAVGWTSSDDIASRRRRQRGERKSILLTARADTLCDFHDACPAAETVRSGVVALAVAFKALHGDPEVPGSGVLQKMGAAADAFDVLVAYFTGEALGLMGSSAIATFFGRSLCGANNMSECAPGLQPLGYQPPGEPVRCFVPYQDAFAPTYGEGCEGPFIPAHLLSSFDVANLSAIVSVDQVGLNTANFSANASRPSVENPHALWYHVFETEEDSSLADALYSAGAANGMQESSCSLRSQRSSMSCVPPSSGHAFVRAGLVPQLGVAVIGGYDSMYSNPRYDSSGDVLDLNTSRIAAAAQSIVSTVVRLIAGDDTSFWDDVIQEEDVKNLSTCLYHYGSSDACPPGIAPFGTSYTSLVNLRGGLGRWTTRTLVNWLNDWLAITTRGTEPFGPCAECRGSDRLCYGPSSNSTLNYSCVPTSATSYPAWPAGNINFTYYSNGAFRILPPQEVGIGLFVESYWPGGTKMGVRLFLGNPKSVGYKFVPALFVLVMSFVFSIGAVQYFKFLKSS